MLKMFLLNAGIVILKVIYIYIYNFIIQNIQAKRQAFINKTRKVMKTEDMPVILLRDSVTALIAKIL